MTYFGTNLKKIRQIKGLSQQAFAELIDLNRGVISSYEEGRAEPKIETLLRIATYFGISTDDIISKPLTVNQLSNFTLIENSISSLEEQNEINIQELNLDGTSENIELQKIFAQFDFVFSVDESLANRSVFDKESLLFLKAIEKESNKFTNYFTLQKGVASISNTLISEVQNYAIVGVLGSQCYAEQKTILQRIELLEKKVFGN